MHQIGVRAVRPAWARIHLAFRAAVACFCDRYSGGPVAAQPAPAATRGLPPAITFILPAAEGGSADRVGRIVASALARILETPVQVKKVPGALGITGTNSSPAPPATAATLGLGLSTPMAGRQVAVAHRRLQPARHRFDWLAIVGTYGIAMIVRQDHPAKSLRIGSRWRARRRNRCATAPAARRRRRIRRRIPARRAACEHGPRAVQRQCPGLCGVGERRHRRAVRRPPLVARRRRSAAFRILAVTSAKRDPLPARCTRVRRDLAQPALRAVGGHRRAQSPASRPAFAVRRGDRRDAGRQGAGRRNCRQAGVNLARPRGRRREPVRQGRHRAQGETRSATSRSSLPMRTCAAFADPPGCAAPPRRAGAPRRARRRIVRRSRHAHHQPGTGRRCIDGLPRRSSRCRSPAAHCPHSRRSMRTRRRRERACRRAARACVRARSLLLRRLPARLPARLLPLQVRVLSRTSVMASQPSCRPSSPQSIL